MLTSLWPRGLLRTAIVLIVGTSIISACGAPLRSAVAKSAALDACNSWTSAGIGVPSVSAADRRSAIRLAVTRADMASANDTRWRELSKALRDLETALSRRRYADQVMPAGLANFHRLASGCEAAGQAP